MGRDTAHAHARRAAKGQDATVYTPRVGCTGETQPTHRANGRSGTPKPLVGARPGSFGYHGKRHPEPWKQLMTGVPAHSPGGGSPAKQRGPATQATGVRRSYGKLAGAILPVVRDTPYAWSAARAAAHRRGHVTLPTDTCGDNLPPRTPGPGGHYTAFPSTRGSGLTRTGPRAVGGTGRPLGKTFFLHCHRRHPKLPRIPTYLPSKPTPRRCPNRSV